jgi:hypothetical protein
MAAVVGGWWRLLSMEAAMVKGKVARAKRDTTIKSR